MIPTKGAVIPSAVGVDIGCGMIAAELDVTEDQLPDSLEPLLVRIEAAIPAGVGKGHDHVARNAERVALGAQAGHRAVGRSGDKVAKQFGTLGSGNHFFELCVDERRRVWVVLHSGSRGIGNKLATMHITKARDSPRTSSCGSRTRTSRTSSRARRSSRRTSPTCSGPRSTHGPTVTR